MPSGLKRARAALLPDASSGRFACQLAAGCAAMPVSGYQHLWVRCRSTDPVAARVEGSLGPVGRTPATLRPEPSNVAKGGRRGLRVT